MNNKLKSVYSVLTYQNFLKTLSKEQSKEIFLESFNNGHCITHTKFIIENEIEPSLVSLIDTENFKKIEISCDLNMDTLKNKELYLIELIDGKHVFTIKKGVINCN